MNEVRLVYEVQTGRFIVHLQCYIFISRLYLGTGMFTTGFLCAVIFQKSCQTEFRNRFL